MMRFRRTRPDAARGRDTARGADATKAVTAPRRPPKPRARREVLRPPTPTATGLLAVTMLLAATGMVMLLSSSAIVGTKYYGWYFVSRQLLWVGLALVGLLVCWRIPYRFWRRWTAPLLGCALFLLVLVLVPGVGKTVAGSTRWIVVGPINIQPSEPVKFAFAVFCADLLTRREQHVENWRKIFVPLAAVGGAIILLVMMQPDMGTTGTIVLVGAGALIVAGVPLRHLRNLSLAGLGVGAVAAWFEPYRRDRLLNFMQPFADHKYQGEGWQVAQSLIGIGSGGLTGVGLGQSRAKWGFLPNAHTDFIFAIIAEEGGLIGALFVVGLFVIMAWLGVRAARRAPDRFGMLLASAITTWLIGQAFINMAYVVGAFPVTGIPLPFVSNGGSALIVCMAAMGVLASVARAGDRQVALEQVSGEPRRSAFTEAVRAPVNPRPVRAGGPPMLGARAPRRPEAAGRSGLFAALVGDGRPSRSPNPGGLRRGRRGTGRDGARSRQYGAGGLADLEYELDRAGADMFDALDDVAGRTPRGGRRYAQSNPLRVIDGEGGRW